MSEVHGWRGGQKLHTCIRILPDEIKKKNERNERNEQNEKKSQRFEYIACTHIRRYYIYNILSKLYYMKQNGFFFPSALSTLPCSLLPPMHTFQCRRFSFHFCKQRRAMNNERKKKKKNYQPTENRSRCARSYHE